MCVCVRVYMCKSLVNVFLNGLYVYMVQNSKNIKGFNGNKITLVLILFPLTREIVTSFIM